MVNGEDDNSNNANWSISLALVANLLSLNKFFSLIVRLKIVHIKFEHLYNIMSPQIFNRDNCVCTWIMIKAVWV